MATSKDVAGALGLSAATIQAYARHGKIPFDETPGGHRRFDVAEVQIALTAPAQSGDEIDVSELRPLSSRLGVGVETPTSALANANRERRSTRPEPRPATAVQAAAPALTAPAHVSALVELVAAARTRSLALTTLTQR